MPTAQRESVVEATLLERISDARRRSDALFEIVQTDAMYDRPIPERHRIVFYIGHLEAFAVNLLHENVFGLRSLHPEFDRLFAFGIDPVGGGLPTDQPADWPSIIDVRDYVMQVREALDTGLARATDETASLLLQVAIEHRLMHAETLAYMLHQLDPSSKIEARAKMELVTNPMRPRML